jgi:Tol biopolymer transport system component
MPLSAGTRLGPYEIVALIGAGGMGEVYRGRDTTLNRDVAIKVLPELFASDAERLARFTREAQILASLNHPNIAHIHGLEASEGVRALVMELVDGEDLAQRLGREAIPLAEALLTATQIAEALAAAHEQGIVHRDLKPANIKLRPDGTVKVLDFGLAKLTHPEANRHPADVTLSPTITSPAMMTGVGVILGTAAYMAPEQAKGREADKRSDIWAFGCVFYEMLTGRRAFEGEDIADTLAAVLKQEPDWTRLPVDLPPSIRTLIHRCLLKDRHRRVSDIAVAKFLLSEQAGATAETVPARVGDREPLRKRVFSLAVAVLLTAVVVGAVAWMLRPGALSSPPLVQFAFSLPEGQQLAARVQAVAVSPDGTHVVYLANNRLYRRSLAELESQAIRGTETGALLITQFVFSPDGSSIAFLSASDGTLKRMPVGGGTPLTITRSEATSGLSWGNDGIVFGESSGIFRVSPNGGMREQLVSVGAGDQVWGPQVLPGGKDVLFTLTGATGTDRGNQGRIVVQSSGSHELKTVIEAGSDARYLPTGHLVYAVSGSLFAVGFDPMTHTVRGEPVPILVGVRRATRAEAIGAAQFSVSRTGSLVYVPGPANAATNLRTLVLSDRNGVSEPLKITGENYAHPRVARDGSRLAVGIDDGQAADVWVYDLAGTSAIRRLTQGGRNRYPVWSGDGQRLAFQSDRQGDLGIFWQRADGGGTAERLTTPPLGVAHVPESWSPDGKYLLFTERKGAASYVLFTLSVHDKRIVPFGNVQSARPTGAAFSPDGRWVTYAAGQGGGILSADRGIFIQPFPANGTSYPLPKTLIDYHPVWSADGSELFYVSASNRPFVRVSVRTQPGVSFGPPVELSQAVPKPGLLAGDVRGYDIRPDGRFLTLSPVVDRDAAGAALKPEIRVMLNWFDELKRLVPTN